MARIIFRNCGRRRTRYSDLNLPGADHDDRVLSGEFRSATVS